jgi:glycerate kinase
VPLRKIILAPAAFKESLSAVEVSRAMAQGVHRASSSIVAIECPIADGGEGTMACLVAAMRGEIIAAIVHGPTGLSVASHFGRIPRADGGAIGVIELAKASGLEMTPQDRRDPTRTTTYGTGELMQAALASGCDELIVCIGGSATVDGGAGLAQACGVRFFDQHDREIKDFMCGGLLHRVARIVKPTRQPPRIRVACDVTNPLCGPNGAAAIYGPQKGAKPEQVQSLDEGLAHFSRIAGGDPDMPGAGAAGGAGYGLVTLLGATMERGIDLVLDAVGFRALCRDADFVMTGEGRLDLQSLQGKACMGVARAAHELGVPTIAIVGAAGEGANRCVNRPNEGGYLHAYFALADRYGVERAMRAANALVADVACEVASAWR